ncbi:MAG: subfamily B ATP-binding cassette protein MsbA [Bacteriovoracaceae bacterium]|jgi:subfamily B ATP-binding cassette protein MsbA
MLSFLKKRLMPYIRPHKGKVFLTILLSFALAAIGGLQVSLVKPIFDSGLSPNSTKEEVYLLAGKLLGLGLLHFPCRFIHFYWIRYIVDNATCEVRYDIFRKLQRLPVGFFTKARQGQLISSVVNDTQVFSTGFRAIVDLIREPLKAIVFLGMAFWADWQLTSVIFVIAPFLIVIFSISGKKVKNNQSVVQKEHGELTHNTAEGIAAQKITKAFNLQNFVGDRFKSAQNLFFKAQMKTTFVEEMAHPFVEIVGTMAFSAVIVFAHHRIQSGATTIGEFISFVAALALFMDPIRKFSQANVRLSQGQAAGDRIFALLEEEEENFSSGEVISSFSQGIEVKNLSFDYGEGAIIKNLSLEIPKGKKVALVGLSGSGKSTLINLLLGLYPVDKGSIFIDGKDINDYELESVRGLTALVSQDIFLFNDTIKKNLTIGQEYSDSEIKEALKVSYADEFVNDLPEGLETVVGDRGTRLSGGQQQRITIARAFLQNKDIMLFDEATSALDNESEKVVQKALENAAGGKTVVAVAHRLSTVQEYDCIYVLKEGSLAESGSHHELMAKNGEYAKLYELSQKA